MSELYNRINELCKARGTNITALCKKAGVSRATLSELNSGRTKTLTFDTAKKIADALGVSLNFLQNDFEDYSKPIEFSIQTSELQDYLNNKKAPIQKDRRGNSNIFNLYNPHDYDEVAKIDYCLPSQEFLSIFDKAGYDISFDSKSRVYTISDRRGDNKILISVPFFVEIDDFDYIDYAKELLNELNPREMYTLYTKYKYLSKSDKKIVDMILNMIDEDE